MHLTFETAVCLKIADTDTVAAKSLNKYLLIVKENIHLRLIFGPLDSETVPIMMFAEASFA